MKKSVLAVIAAFSFILAGCFDITEEVFLEKNGSGSYVSTIDMSQMKETLDMLKAMAPDSVKGKDLNLNIADSLQKSWKDLETVSGITDIKKEKKSDFIYVISFRFANIKALNAALAKRKKPEEQQNIQEVYSFAPGSFTCNDTSMSGLGDIFKGLNQGAAESDSAKMAIEMIKGFMGDMKYTSVIHFPGKVSSFSNKNATLSEDGKTLTTTIKFMDEGQLDKTLRNDVKFENK